MCRDLMNNRCSDILYFFVRIYMSTPAQFICLVLCFAVHSKIMMTANNEDGPHTVIYGNATLAWLINIYWPLAWFVLLFMSLTTVIFDYAPEVIQGLLRNGTFKDL